MQWESWAQFWDMGGAAKFVWGSYGLSFALIALEIVLVLRRRGETMARLARWQRAMGRNSGRNSASRGDREVAATEVEQ